MAIEKRNDHSAIYMVGNTAGVLTVRRKPGDRFVSDEIALKVIAVGIAGTAAIAVCKLRGIGILYCACRHLFASVSDEMPAASKELPIWRPVRTASSHDRIVRFMLFMNN
jgi:hypothetical protein